jgi:uncharacterized protein YegL
MASNIPKPNIRIQPRTLDFYFLLDTSGSMTENGRITSLNLSVKNSIPGMIQAAKANPNARVMIHVATFGGKAEWHLHPGILIDEFIWDPIQASDRSNTPMGAALDMVIDDLETKVNQRSLPPVLVMITDGVPTDKFDRSVSRLIATTWASKSIRIGIGIGPKSEVGWDVLERFMYGMPFKPLHAADSRTLSQFIRWSTTTVLRTATQAKDASAIPPLPDIELDYDLWDDEECEL